MFNATDWKLTSLAGMSMFVPTPVSFVSLPIGKLPLEFTNTVTGAKEKFEAWGGGASLGAPGLLSRLVKMPKTVPGVSFSPSMFTSSGMLYGMQLAKTPFDITQLHHRFLGMDDIGFAVGVSGSVGVMIFSYAPSGGGVMSFGIGRSGMLVQIERRSDGHTRPERRRDQLFCPVSLNLRAWRNRGHHDSGEGDCAVWARFIGAAMAGLAARVFFGNAVSQPSVPRQCGYIGSRVGPIPLKSYDPVVLK
jgi:hypothetical protein